MARRGNCEAEVKDLLLSLSKALEGYRERGYFTDTEVGEVGESLEDWRACSRSRETGRLRW